MTTTRFHKAARDGNMEILKEASSSQCNSRDEDGMTPVLWAAFQGNLDALRLLAGRGGDVDKSDHYGNSALHFAAAKGHMSCVVFLANFGANLWAKDIDLHTPKDLAAMNSRHEILRFLDSATAKAEASNKKAAKAKQEKAQKAADKLIKQYEKREKETKKLAEREQKRLEKERRKMEEDGIIQSTMPHRPSTLIWPIRKITSANQSKKTKPHISTSNPTFSTYVGTAGGGSSGRRVTGSGRAGGVKALIGRKQGGTVTSNEDFRVGEIEADGKRSLTSITGLRRDSQVIYRGSFDPPGLNKRGKLTEVFEVKSELNRSVSEPEFLHTADSGFGDDLLIQEPASIFVRPGFGSVAFRNSISQTLSNMPVIEDEDSAVESEDKDGESGKDDSIGSAGSLKDRNNQNNGKWDDDDDIDSDSSLPDWSAMQMFLVSAGLQEYTGLFVREQFDLESLMMINEEDLTKLGLKFGPIKKLMAAIEKRRTTLGNPGKVEDSPL